MKIILFNQNPMITKLLESVSKKLELSMEDFNRYQELSTRLKEDPEWILIADDECLEKLDQVDWLELKETISQNKNSVCMYKKGNEAQPFLEGFEMKIKKPFLPTEVLKVLQKKLGSNASELEPSQNLNPTQEVLETNWDELENLGDLEALVQEEPNNEEQLLPTLNDQEEKEEVKEEVKEEEKEEVKEEEKEEVKEEEKEEVKETPQEEKPKDDEIQEGETLKDEEVSKELETQEELEIPKEETQEQAKEQEPIKEETQDSPSAQELEAMQELVKEIQENSNGQEDKKETQENTETPQELEKQELEKQELEKQEKTQESAETPQDVETPQEKETQKLETPQEEIQENTETPQEKETPQESAETPQEKTQKLETQEDHYESIEDIPEPVMAQAMGEELPFLNESVAKTSNNENDTETPKESVIKTPQEKEESDKTSSPLELRLNLQDLLKSLNQESLKSLLENKTLSIKITLEDKKPDA
ncbi:chemotaxis regulatory protein ChePep [Helicobacter pylori]